MAANRIQLKRTSVSGRTPNTTNAGNSQYIATGELALNLADGVLYTSDGTDLINLTPAGGSITVRSTNGSGGTVNTAVTGVTGINFDESTGIHVTDQGSGNVFVSLGSSFKTIQVSGQDSLIAVGEDTLSIANGAGITLTTSNSAPKTLTISTNASALNVNSALNANNASYLGTVAAANYIQNTDSRTLSGNLTFSGIATFDSNVIFNGQVTTFESNNLVLSDNMIYLNSNNTGSNPDIGFAANYNDGTYHHAGFFRDHTSGVWKVFDNYDPEPDASQFIDQSNTSFHIADFQANIVYVGNTSVYATINTTSFTGTSNNASYLGTVAAANYLTNTGAFTISGVHTHSANVVMNNGAVIVANGSLGTSGQVLATNGSSMYWATATGGGGSSVTVSDTAPSSPSNGDLWYYTGSSELYIYYNDGDSSQWVTTATAAMAISTANNALYLGGTIASGYQTTAGLSANVATLTSNNANYLGGVAAANYASTGKAIAMAIVFGG